MKNIGIITFHRATNYGAVLQAYSFVNRLRKDFGEQADIEIIDYSTRAASIDHIRAVVGSMIFEGGKAGLTEYKKNRIFQNFSEQLPVSEKRFVSDDIKKIFQYMNNKYDIVISGSDAVFSWNGKKFPIAYLLGQQANYKKFSYAASAHRLAYREETDEKKLYCKQAFESYHYLGVRDSETERFVKHCAPNANVFHNCDPSFFIDLEAIKGMVDFSRFDFGNKPLILVMTSNEEIGKIVTEQYESSYTIASLFVKNRYIKRHFGTLTPFEWACVFGKAVLTVTEYFHGTIFSLLNGTPVVSIDGSGYSNGYEGKIHDLLYSRLGLEDMYVNIDEIRCSGANIVSKRMETILDNNDSSRIVDAIQRERQQYSYFKEALNKEMEKC